MNSYEIARLVSNLNIAAVCVAVFFAAAGAVFIAGALLGRKRFRGVTLPRAFCAASLAALAAEATFFNFQYYLRFFAGPEIHTTEPSPNAPNTIMTSENTAAELVDGGVIFKDLDRAVTSVFVDVDFSNSEIAEMDIQWDDAEGTRGYRKKIFKHMPHENYAPIQPHGNVSAVSVTFTSPASGVSINVSEVALNRPIPLYFSGLRLLAVSLLLFALFSVAHKTLRAHAARFLFEYGFDPTSKKQGLALALSAVLLILFSWICANTSVREQQPLHLQYNQFLVDALISGRTWLDYGNPEKLLEAKEPYNLIYRKENNYDVMWDWAWYKGKYYSYFGVVPAVILFVPYRLLTGNYLPNHTGVWIFASIFIILLAALWRACVKKYMPNMTFAFYMLSFLTLFFASGLYGALRHALVYSIVQTAALMFAVGGVLLLLKSIDGEKVSRVKLFFACLCFALIAGCRPNMVFISLLVPVILWKHRSWKLLPFIAIPALIVAVPLCAYNHARFGSIFDFGANYNITAFNLTAYNSINPIGKIIRIFTASMHYLFYPNKILLHFPFVETHMPATADGVTLGAYRYFERGSSLINFPIVFCLLLFFRNIANRSGRPETFGALAASLAIAAVIMILNSLLSGFAGRYTMDIALLIVFPSIFFAHHWYAGTNDSLKNTRAAIACALLAASIFTGLFLFVNGTPFVHSDPVLYRYLEYSLGIVREI